MYFCSLSNYGMTNVLKISYSIMFNFLCCDSVFFTFWAETIFNTWRWRRVCLLQLLEILFHWKLVKVKQIHVLIIDWSHVNICNTVILTLWQHNKQKNNINFYHIILYVSSKRSFCSQWGILFPNSHFKKKKKTTTVLKEKN